MTSWPPTRSEPTRPPTVERLGGLGVIAVCVEGAALDG